MLLLNDKIVNKIILMKGKIGEKKVNQNSRANLFAFFLALAHVNYEHHFILNFDFD